MVTALHRKLLRDLAVHKAQVATIAVVVTCGVAVFVGSMGTWASLTWARDSWYERGRFAHVFAVLERAPESLGDRLATLPGVSVAETRIEQGVTLQFEDIPEPVTGHLVSLPDGRQPRLNQLLLKEGRLPAPERGDEVVLNEAFAAAHDLGPGDAVVAVMEGRVRPLRVVGVASSPEWLSVVPPSGLPDDRLYGVLWMARSAMEGTFDMDGAFNSVVLSLSPGASVPAVLDAVDRLLEPHGGIGAIGQQDQTSHRFVSEELQQQRAMAIVLPVIFMGVAAFLVNVVLARLVAAERMQIATLKALGYFGRDIAVHYLQFVLVIAGLGTVAGVLLGTAMVEAQLASYRQFFHFPTLVVRMQAWIPLGAAAVAISTAAAAALGAVSRVARLPPAQAMRPESPDTYRRGVIERAGLDRRASPRLLLVLRGIAHRPLRAVFTSVGVAFAAAILVAGMFFFDVMDVLLDVHFERAQREDFAVTFYRRVPDRALSELAHLPGVLAVEGQRVVPVRLVAEHLKVDTALLGYPSGATHRRVLDRHGRPSPPPEEGVLLGGALARKLGVRPGDRLRVELREGDFGHRELTVTGTVEDLAGLTAAMDRRALNRLMREGPSISQATVLLDPSRRAAFLTALKQRPLVASVAPGADAIRAFMDSMGGIILVFAAILTAFSAAIAVGVVYNAARIAFAERAHDLASLRVLGFTRKEVSTMLLSELGLEFLVGLPIGLWLGWVLAWAASLAFSTELFRFPLVITLRTYGFATLVVTLSALISAWVVRGMLDRFDLISVLKTYE